MEMSMTVDDLAHRLNGKVEGDGSLQLTGVRGLADAQPTHLSFLANPRYLRQFHATRAGAVLIVHKLDAGGRTVIRCDDPYVAFARALQLFHPRTLPDPGVDERAWVAPDAVVTGARIEAFAWIGPGAVVGAGSWIEAGAHVGAGARIGAGCRLMAHSVVCDGCELGDRVWLNPGAVVGAEGFGFAPGPEGNVKIPQIGRAVVGEDVEIGANSCIDRGAVGDTVIHRGAKLDNLVQVGHGAEVGEHALLAGCSAVAGSARLGKRVVLAGRAGVINHVRLGDGVQVSTGAIVVNDQPAGAQVAGVPAFERGRWKRSIAVFRNLADVLLRLRRLERRVDELGDGRQRRP